MKKLMIMGGLTGFLIGFGVGVINDVTWPALFLRASVGAFVAGLLMRWWGGLWIRGLRDSHEQRIADAAALRIAAATAKK